jgi:hypothetical protein
LCLLCVVNAYRNTNTSKKSRRNTFIVIWVNTHNNITAYKGDKLDVKCLDLFAETSIIEFTGTFHDASSCRLLIDIKK